MSCGFSFQQSKEIQEACESKMIEAQNGELQH